MKKHSVRFLPAQRSAAVAPGTTLAEAARAAGVELNNLCGGEGVCGQCRLQVLRGPAEADAHARALLSAEEIAAGYVLACQTRVTGELEIQVPPQSRVEGVQILTREEGSAGDGFPIRPLVRKIHLELTPPTPDDNAADIDRVSRELRRQLGWHSFDVTLECLQNLADTLRRSDWRATASVLHTGSGYCIQRLEPGDTTASHFGVAVDVGTTTVVAQLVDLNSGQVLGVEGTPNQQASYGEDVISRMIFACGKGGLSPLHDAVATNLNALIDTLTRAQGIAVEDVGIVVAAGNTTMSHFLLGLSPCSIRLEPYVPTADVYPLVSAREVGLRIHPQGMLQVIPGVASYVGGDIVAGVMACGMTEHPEVQGLIDIGTNGEIAIGNQEWLVCCSASAGPAFEGGGTRCGMRATKGAIEKIEIREDGQLHYRTIAEGRPRGICGSGLIDCIHEFVRNGIIGADGKFNLGRRDERLSVVDGIPVYTLAGPAESESGDPVVVTEPDIANLIKSKGAVFAAIKCLTDYIGLGFDQIERFHVAGGFGNFLDIPKAVAIGLLPDIPRERIRFIGNSSLTGARLALLSEEAFEKCVTVSRSMTNIELTSYPPFMDEYVAALFLPHTNRKLFPSVTY